MMITLTIERFGCYGVEADDGRDLLVQTDWDFPGLARSFGWRSRKKYKDPGQEIQAAIKYLDAHEGKRVRDPGYFDAE